MRWMPILLCDLHYMDSIGTDEFCVEILISEVSDLLLGGESLVQATHHKRHAVDDPVIAEIAKRMGLASAASLGM